MGERLGKPRIALDANPLARIFAFGVALEGLTVERPVLLDSPVVVWIGCGELLGIRNSPYRAVLGFGVDQVAILSEKGGAKPNSDLHVGVCNPAGSRAAGTPDEQLVVLQRGNLSPVQLDRVHGAVGNGGR